MSKKVVKKIVKKASRKPRAVKKAVKKSQFKPIPCEICKRPISSWPPAMARHMGTHGIEKAGKIEIAPAKDGKFKCPTCDKPFDSAQAVIGHMRVHSSKPRARARRPNATKWGTKCPVCGIGIEGFSDRSSFAGHCRKHTRGPMRKRRDNGGSNKDGEDGDLPFAVVVERDDSCSEEHAVEVPILIKIKVAVIVERS